MINTPGGTPEAFKSGQVLTAKALNALSNSILKRLVGAAPIKVKQGAAGHVLISMDLSSDPKTQKLETMTATLGEMLAEEGTYKWTKLKGDGPESGGDDNVNPAKELNLTPDIEEGTIVQLTKIDGVWYFRAGEGAVNVKLVRIDSLVVPGIGPSVPRPYNWTVEGADEEGTAKELYAQVIPDEILPIRALIHKDGDTWYFTYPPPILFVTLGSHVSGMTYNFTFFGLSGSTIPAFSGICLEHGDARFVNTSSPIIPNGTQIYVQLSPNGFWVFNRLRSA